MSTLEICSRISRATSALGILALASFGLACSGAGGGDSWEGEYWGSPKDDEVIKLLEVEKGDEGRLQARIFLDEKKPEGEIIEVRPASPDDLVGLLKEKAVECNASAILLDKGGALLKLDPGCEFKDGEEAKTGYYLVILFGALEVEKRS